MSPAGTSVLAPMCLDSSRMNATQNLRISLSDLPLGSKSAPPLPPPIFTTPDQPIVIVSSRAVLTTGQGVLEYLLEAQELEDG